MRSGEVVLPGPRRLFPQGTPSVSRVRRARGRGAGRRPGRRPMAAALGQTRGEAVAGPDWAVRSSDGSDPGVEAPRTSGAPWLPIESNEPRLSRHDTRESRSGLVARSCESASVEMAVPRRTSGEPGPLGQCWRSSPTLRQLWLGGSRPDRLAGPHYRPGRRPGRG